MSSSPLRPRRFCHRSLPLIASAALCWALTPGAQGSPLVQPEVLFDFPAKYANSYLERDGALVQAGDERIFIVTRATLYLRCGQWLTLAPASGQVSQLGVDKRAIGCQPQPDLAVDAQGSVWGLSSRKGPEQHGSLLSVPNAGMVRLAHAYTALEGDAGQTLVVAPDGSLQVVRQITPDSPYGQWERHAAPDFLPQLLYRFSASDPVRAPYALAVQQDGTVYGLALNNPGDGGSSLVRLGGVSSPLQVLAQLRPYGRLNPSLVAQGQDHVLVSTPGDGQTDPGSLLRIGLDGAVTVLHSFDGIAGRGPLSSPVPAPDGWLYGSTARGGPANLGLLYRVRPEGSDYQVLHTFDGSQGSTPRAALLLARDGLMYGRTATGGKRGNGVVFRFARPADAAH
jgi:uncharacterized repeat protein (TIGR03803 family)